MYGLEAYCIPQQFIVRGDLDRQVVHTSQKYVMILAFFFHIFQKISLLQ